MTPGQDALQIFHTATAAVHPAQLISKHLSTTNEGIIISNHFVPFNSCKNIYVIGAGKAAAAMAVVTEDLIGNYITDGLVITKYGHALPCTKIKIFEGAHPVPDYNCINAVKATIQLLQNTSKEDIVICLISGGASALWCDVPQGIALEEIQATFDQLIKSGATIHEINTVRRHLSSIKGGKLVSYCNSARLFSLIISDVPDDDLSVIASGPTVGDKTTYSDAHAILNRYNLFDHIPESVQSRINKGIHYQIADTPMPNDPLFQNTTNTIIGSNAIAIEAAGNQARELGYTVYIDNTLITGDAETEAKKFIEKVMQCKGDKPACFLQGGETTVKVTGNGKGGRNQHFVLSALNEWSKVQNANSNNNLFVLSGGTDGTDGPTEATGAIGNNEILQFAKEKALSIPAYLHDHNAYEFFQQTGGLIITGATQTNVMDIMLAIVY